MVSRPDGKPETDVGHGRVPPKDSLEASEQLALGLPREGKAGVFHQPVRGKRSRLPAIQDRRDNVGREEREPDEARDVRTADPLLGGDLSKG